VPFVTHTHTYATSGRKNGEWKPRYFILKVREHLPCHLLLSTLVWCKQRGYTSFFLCVCLAAQYGRACPRENIIGKSLLVFQFTLAQTAEANLLIQNCKPKNTHTHTHTHKHTHTHTHTRALTLTYSGQQSLLVLHPHRTFP